MKIYNAKDGEWITIPKRNLQLTCCSCGLVHDLQFKITNGVISFRAFRNEKATEQVRQIDLDKKFEHAIIIPCT